MSTPTADMPPLAILHTHISTEDFPASDYIVAVRDALGRDTMGIDLRPPDGDMRSLESFRYHARIGLLGTQAAYMHSEHTPIRMRRTAALIGDGLDDIFLTSSWSPSGGSILRHDRNETAIPSGSMLLMSKSVVHEGIIPWDATTVGLQVPRAALARLLPGLEEAPLHIFTPGTAGADSAALALSYAALLARQSALSGAPLASAVTHLHQLLAAAIDTRRASGLPPDSLAQQLPRLALIQRDIRARSDQHDLSLDTIARLHHLTPRQVQRLFARQDITFSGFLAQARMERAHAMLTSPLHRQRRVLEIALDSGFDDISAFSRAFRRHYGMTPSEAREHSGITQSPVT